MGCCLDLHDNGEEVLGIGGCAFKLKNSKDSIARIEKLRKMRME